MDAPEITRQVQYNCDVSDARYAGIYSICGLAMRLRELYKWDQHLAPWQEHESGQVLDWIGRRETLWESLAEAEFQSLTIDGRAFEAFDSQAINALLIPQGLFYGAGYAQSLKPTFFLAEVDGCDTIAGRTVWRLGRELARDLLTLPAFSQDDQVVLRTEAARMYLWDQIAYMSNSGRPALNFALAACCGLPDGDTHGIRRHFDTILNNCQTTYIRHELGEVADPVFDRTTWRRMLSDFPHTPVELLIRTLKDVLADTGEDGPIVHFCAHHDHAGLGFYMAFRGGLAPLLFAELTTSFASFMQNGDWSEVARAARQVRHKAADYVGQVTALYNKGGREQDLAAVRKAIEATLAQRGVTF
ncbi:MAG: hypothetical protein KFF50_07475 [Desulfatitalea sp.]|nr:hypothetical protein [Desulfatitalea sp.]